MKKSFNASTHRLLPFVCMDGSLHSILFRRVKFIKWKSKSWDWCSKFQWDRLGNQKIQITRKWTIRRLWNHQSVLVTMFCVFVHNTRTPHRLRNRMFAPTAKTASGTFLKHILVPARYARESLFVPRTVSQFEWKDKETQNEKVFPIAVPKSLTLFLCVVRRKFGRRHNFSFSIDRQGAAYQCHFLSRFYLASFQSTDI